MTSILKADTIQDAAGNNIINENANTITIGASGDTINIPSGATFNVAGTAGTGFGLIKLSSATASTSGSLSFNLDITNYDSFLLTGYKVTPVTDGAEPYLYFSEDSGSSYLTADFYSGRTYLALTGGSGTGAEQNTIAGAVQLGTDLGNDGPGSFQAWLPGMSAAYSGGNKFCNATYTSKHNTNDYTWDTGFIVIGNNAVNNVKFQMSTVNITTGVLTLYGLRK